MRKIFLINLITCLLIVATVNSTYAQDRTSSGSKPSTAQPAHPQSVSAQSASTAQPAQAQSVSAPSASTAQPAQAQSVSAPSASTAQPAQAQSDSAISKAAKDATGQTPTSMSDQATILPATTRMQAVQRAKANAGRTDPLAPVEGFKPFPRGATTPDAKPHHNDRSSAKMLIPPPPGGVSLQVPPPPNAVSSGSATEDLPVSELPVPPERPSIVNKLKLIGIIGQKAIFTITDLSARRVNKWPRSLMLGTGEHFESVEVVSISADSALLEENGEQTTKRLERIR
jgi:hypothetical protein